MRKKEFAKALLLSSLFIAGGFLTACGGGGGGGEGGGGGVATATYLAYRGSVWLVDPNNLTSPIPISDKPTLDSESLMVVGSYNPSTKSYTDLHIHEIFWIDDTDGNPANGGTLMKVSMVKGSSTPSASQVSNLNNVCEILYSEDDPIGKKKYMVVKTAGSNGTCGDSDDGKYLVHSGMSATDDAINMGNKEILTAVDGGFSNPEITGFVLFDSTSGTIEKCNTNLGNCTTLASGIASAEDFATNPNDGKDYICASTTSSPGTYTLYLTDGSNWTNTNVTCNTTWITENDDQAIYAVNAGNIQKFTYGGSEWSTIYNGGDATGIYALTSNYVIAGTGSSLKAVKKDGTTTLDIYTFGDENIVWFFPTSNSLFFSVVNYSTGAFKACRWTEGDSNATYESGNYWAGVSLAPNGNLNLSGGFFIPVYKLVKVEGPTNAIAGGGTLYAVDPSNLSSKTNLGTVPNNFTLLGFGIGDNILLLGRDSKGNTDPDDQNDIFYTNLSQANSLTQITNTPNKNEFPIY